MARAKKIFVGNYKGGVGKTTSIYQIALHMADLENKVLLIDLDPQCSLSEICLKRIDSSLDTLKRAECLNYLYDYWIQIKPYRNIQFIIEGNVLIKQMNENIHFIPSNIFYQNGGLDSLAMKLTDDFEDLFVLQQFFKISQIEEKYDYILFDCPPSNNLITQGAFLLSDYYIIPSIIQTISIRGVVHYIQTVEKIYEKYCHHHEKRILAQQLFGAKPKLLGIFETLKKGTVKNEAILIELKSELRKSKFQSLLGDKFIFDTTINNYEIIARDTAEGKQRNEYAELTEEILACIDRVSILNE